jgi:hypothetical protein
MSKGLMNSVIHNKGWHGAAILSDKSELGYLYPTPKKVKIIGSSSGLGFLRTLGASAKTKTRATRLPSNEIATSQQLLLSRLPLGFAAFAINVLVFFLIRALGGSCLHRECVRTPKARKNLKFCT